MAADKLVDSTQLDGAMTSTANAIRAKTGGSSSLTWDLTTGFSVPIGDIVTLAEGTANDTATAADILSGKKAHVKGALVTGTIPSKAAATFYPDDEDQTIASGQYLSGAQTIKAVKLTNLAAANIKHNVVVKVGDASDDVRITSVTGSFTSDGTAAAANMLKNVIGYAKGTKYTGNIETLTAANITVNGKTITIPVHKYTGTSSASPITKSIADGDYSADSSASTNSTVTPSMTITNASSYGFTTTKPSGAYQTLTPGFSASAWSVTPRANITTAGYLAEDSKTGTAVTNTPVAGTYTPYYVPVVTPTFSGGILTKNDFTKNDLALTLSDGSDENVDNYMVGDKDTTNYPYYVKVNGSTPAVIGSTSATRGVVTYNNNPGVIAKHTNTTATLSAASTIEPSVNVNATNESVYVGFKKATMTVAGTNTVSPTAEVEGNGNVTLGTTNNGIAVTATGGGTASVTATATTNVAGYAPASTQLGSGTLSAPSNTTTQTKYITAVTVPASKSLTVTNNGTVPMTNSGSTTITSESNGNGSSVKVAAYSLESSTKRTSKDVVSNGRWVTTNVTANGTYFGRVVVSSGTITNPATLPSGGSSTQISRGNYIKVGAGFYNSDVYYRAQPNSGTYAITSSNYDGNGGNITVDGYQYATVSAAESDTNAASASITTSSSDSTSITLAETQPSSGNFYTLTANGSGSSKIKTSGWIKTGALETTSTTKSYYVTKGVISNNQSSGTSSGTVNRGKKIKIGKGYYPADLYYTAQANSGTVTISQSGDTSCDGKVTVTVPAATPAFDGGTLSGGSTATGTSCTIDTTANNGITIQTKYTGASTAMLYNGAVNGWVTVADNAEALAGKTLSSTNGTLYYLTAVTVPKDINFSVTTTQDTALDTSSDLDITNNAYRRVDISNKANGSVVVSNIGTVSITSASNNNGSSVSISAYDTTSSSSATSKNVVTNGYWVSPSVTASGTYYGRVVVPSATPAFTGGALNNQGATIASTNAAVSTSDNSSGITITAKGTAGRAAVTYNGAVSGFVKVNSGATASAAVSATTWDGTTYYLNGVELKAGKTFTITVPNGSASNKINFVFHVDSNNNVTVTET